MTAQNIGRPRPRASGAKAGVRAIGLFRAPDGVLVGHALLLDAFGLLRQLGVLVPLTR